MTGTTITVGIPRHQRHGRPRALVGSLDGAERLMSQTTTQAAPTTTVGGMQRISAADKQLSASDPSRLTLSSLVGYVVYRAAASTGRTGMARVDAALLPWPGCTQVPERRYGTDLRAGRQPAWHVVYLVSGTRFWMVERGTDDTTGADRPRRCGQRQAAVSIPTTYSIASLVVPPQRSCARHPTPMYRQAHCAALRR